MWPLWKERDPDPDAVSYLSQLSHFKTLENIDRVLKWFRVCAVCRSPWPPIELLCEKCLARLRPYLNSGENLRQQGYPFPVYSLITWSDETDQFAKPLLHAFKKGWAFGAATTFAEVLSSERRSLSEVVDPLFVHPPASVEGRRDHSWLLAQALAENWDTECLALLPKGHAPATPQKKQKAGERANRRFVPVTQENFSHSGGASGVPFVFVDDVITSGSTAMAAYMALGDPDRFEVWTLVCRPKLAGKSRF
jgi:predicted amidophosphoribosyltransferase